MRYISFHLIVLCLLLGLSRADAGAWSSAPPPGELDSKPVPRLMEREGHATCFMVDGRPMLLLAGEPLNSTGSYPERLGEVLAEMKAAHYNTALIAISWQMIEPEEGKMNFSAVDDLLRSAREHDMRIGLLWFGSWKNGISPYAPSWVLGDTRRFERVRSSEGENTMTLSPFCAKTREADARAFTSLMAYLAGNDPDRRVITVQVENEIGILGQSRDFSPEAEKAFRREVPASLLSYMTRNKGSLERELLAAWSANGFKTSGTWEEVFGKDVLTDLFFMAWTYASFVEEVAARGKEAYPLPMFVNCWMSQKRPQQLKPGHFPSGGPVLQVLDIWKAGAPHIDFLSPDIYDDRTFYDHPNDFHRPDNPLFVPEMHMQEGRATFLVAEHDAMGVSPFGLDGNAGNVANEYAFLDQMMPVILQYQGTGKMHGFMRWTPEDDSLEFRVDDEVTLVVKFNKRTPGFRERGSEEVRLPPAYGLVIMTSNREIIAGGLNFYLSARSTHPKKEVWLNNVREGSFDGDGNWRQLGIRNGDEAGFLSFKTPHYSIGKYGGYHQGAVGSTTIPATFKMEIIRYDKK